MPSLYYKNDSTWEQIQLVSFPVGAIYMSYTSTSPASFIGGSWTQIQERFLLAAGGGYDAGDTGGETEHTLTVAEVPSHWHTINFYSGAMRDAPYQYLASASGLGTYNKASGSAKTGVNPEGDRPHNNMPPYLVVYIWRRTA